MGWCSILLVDICNHIYFPFPPQLLVRDDVLIFWEISQGVLANSKYSQKLWLIDVDHCGLCGHLPTSFLPKFGHETLNCASIRYTGLVKIFPALPLCQKNWFCGKARLDNSYLLLRNIVSSWIHIGVKRISQAWCLHHLKKLEKIVKHNFGMKKKIGPPCSLLLAQF